MARVALDLLGGDGAPEVVADAVALLAGAGVDLVLVGPSTLAARLLAERRINPASIDLIDAPEVLPMREHPLEALRADHACDRPALTVTAAARAVRDGRADAMVSVGHTGGAVAASVLALGRIDGMTRPALAVVLPAAHGPVVLTDAGAWLDATPETLLQNAMAGWCYARSLEIPSPAVGLLNVGHESGKGDALRVAAGELLADRLPVAGIPYVGNVEGHDVADGRRAQVVVTDGFTGNALLKGIEGAVAWAAEAFGRAYADPGPARLAAAQVAAGDFAGGMLLGVQGVAVVGHGAGTAPEIASCVRLAARAADHDIVGLTQQAFASIIAREAS